MVLRRLRSNGTTVVGSAEVDTPCLLILHHGSQTFSAVEGLNSCVRLVDTLEAMSDEMVDGKLTAHHSLDQFGDVCPGLEPTKGRALPNTSGDKLEGASRNLVPACGDADDARDAPSTMGTFQRGAHDVYVAGAIKSVVSTLTKKIGA